MKKKVKIILLVLVVAFILSFFLLDYDGEKIPFEECASVAVGQWDDPLGKAPSIILNEDKTTEYLGETFTWDVTWSSKANKNDSDPSDGFLVKLYDAEGAERYEFWFKYAYSEQVWQLYSVDPAEAGADEELPYGNHQLFKAGTVDVIPVDQNNFEQYFEFLQIFEWKTKERKDWDYHLYLVLKPEYEEKVIETRWKGKVGVTVEHRNYNISVDAETDTVTLGDVCDPSSAPSVEYEKLELHMYKADHRYKEGYLSLAYIFMPKDYSNNSYVARAEVYTLDPFLYPLVLKK